VCVCMHWCKCVCLFVCLWVASFAHFNANVGLAAASVVDFLCCCCCARCCWDFLGQGACLLLVLGFWVVTWGLEAFCWHLWAAFWCEGWNFYRRLLQYITATTAIEWTITDVLDQATLFIFIFDHLYVHSTISEFKFSTSCKYPFKYATLFLTFQMNNWNESTANITSFHKSYTNKLTSKKLIMLYILFCLHQCCQF